jgi:hypothetical protein
VLVFINLSLVLVATYIYLHLLALLVLVAIPSDGARDTYWYYLALLLSRYLIISCDQKEYKDMNERVLQADR